MAAAGPGTLVALATGDVIKVRIATIWQSQLGLQVRYYRVTVAVGGPMQGEIASTLDGIYAPQLKPCLHIAATYRGTDVQRIWPLPPAAPAYEVANQGLGTVAGDGLPSYVCGLYGFVTQRAGRRYRGRTYIPFPGEASSDATGRPSGAYQTLASAWGSTLWTQRLVSYGAGARTATLDPILWHRDTLTWDVITGGAVRIYWASQRRRGDFGRTNLLPF